jgi:hypothetical protein
MMISFYSTRSPKNQSNNLEALEQIWVSVDFKRFEESIKLIKNSSTKIHTLHLLGNLGHYSCISEYKSR